MRLNQHSKMNSISHHNESCPTPSQWNLNNGPLMSNSEENLNYQEIDHIKQLFNESGPILPSTYLSVLGSGVYQHGGIGGSAANPYKGYDSFANTQPLMMPYISKLGDHDYDQLLDGGCGDDCDPEERKETE